MSDRPIGRVDAEALKNVIKSSGVPHKENHVSYKFTCPMCKRPEKLYIRKRDGRYVCWYCRSINKTQGRNPEFILATMIGSTPRELQEQLYKGSWVDSSPLLLDIHLDGDDEEEFLYEEPLVDAASVTYDHDYHPIDAPAAARGLAYLEGRGIPLEVAKAYKLRYCPRKRSVSFPVEYEGILYGYQDRLIIDNEWFDEEAGEMRSVPKIRSRKSVDDRSWRDRTVMFMDRLKDVAFDHAVVCEGPIDAIKAHLCGGNVALMGKSFSPGQVDLLRRLGVGKVYLGLDPDAAEEMSQLVHDLSDVQCYLMEVPQGKLDLGAMTFDEVHELYKSSRRVDSTRLFIHLR